MQILPTLVGLMVAVGVLRASGFLDFLTGVLGGLTEKVHFPSELLPLAIVRMFSASAATGLALDIFKEYGTDSYVGLAASIMMGCTETVFYTMSIYFMTAKVKEDPLYAARERCWRRWREFAVSVWLAGRWF